MTTPKIDTACKELDHNCAPAKRCELTAGHDGPHQWTMGETTVRFPRPLGGWVVPAAPAITPEPIAPTK